MTEAQLFEALGRKQAALDTLLTEYDRLLSLLEQVVDGRIDSHTVRVDLAGRRWEVVFPGVPEPIVTNGISNGPSAVSSGL